jgi:glycosyltransferase involved in cell wall biosynthesis
MRLVIDLQACQNGAARAPEAILALSQALARSAASHTVLVALAGSHADSIDRLRQEFSALLPSQHILCYALPPADDAWSQRAAELARDAFFASLNADAVLAPGLFDRLLPETVCGAGPDGVAMAYSLADAGVLQAPRASNRRAQAERQLDALRNSQVVLAASAAERQLLLPQLAQQTVLALSGDAEADAALLWPALEAAVAQQAAAAAEAGAAEAAAARRPRLAYISPLPPEHSGIADYSAELVAELQQYYEIELVTAHSGPQDAALAARFPIRTPDYFEQHAASYQHVLYHFGNSNAHQYMFELLQRQPGVVVLHDFFLSGVLDNMERDGVQAQAFLQALYESHGYTGLAGHRDLGRNPAIWAYPCNKAVLDHATGVIVHADFSRALAEQWYGPGAADGWRTLPLLRGMADQRPPAQQRASARAALGLAEDAFLVASFGMLGSTKLNHRLLDAFLASPLAQDPRAQLVFVGQNDAGPYGAELERRIAGAGCAASIRITGFASSADYAHYLAASDAAVQLRAQTRGETSASVLDCLLYGVPTIINAHGAAATLPDDVLLKLPDEFSDDALSAALAELHASPARRAALHEAGRAHVRTHHAPAAVGRQYVEALEHFARHSPRAHYQRLLAAISRIADGSAGAPRHPGETQLIGAAVAIARNQPAGAPRQLLLDISALVQTDHKTGIQRVVRSILLALIKAPPPGFRIEPVFSTGGGHPYRYARRFTFGALGLQEGLAPQLEDAPAETRPGDIFLGLDLATNSTTQNEALLLDLRRRGVAVWFVLYDLLPLLRPDSFPYGAQKYYGDYVNTITLAADGIVTISRAVADELAHWLQTHPNRRTAPLQLSYFHLGADISASAPSSGLPDNAEAVRSALAAAPTLLMVGTLEPRKGQAQALAACELLWEKGVALNLVIVGKNGWMVDALVKRLEQHPQREQRLFWLPGVSDQMLLELYGASSALLAASEGEGYGLPLIEAAQHQLPVIARDIPVFREVAGEHAFYFTGKEPAALAAAIEAWLALRQQGQAPASARMPWLTWQQSAQQLVDAVVHGHGYARVDAGAVAPQLLVDVSAVARDDLKTGIQRVVRAQLWELMQMATTRFRVHPVYLTDEGGQWHYRYAQRYEHTLLGTDSYGVVDAPVQVKQGDVFYSPDFFPGAVSEAAGTGLYTRWRAAGVSVNFLVHDILPVLRPDFFPARTDRIFENWLHAVSSYSDRLICISAAVADETRAWIRKEAPQRALPQFAVLHHGADINASRPSSGLSDDAQAVLADIAAAPSFLMVGTIEPRKGHLQALQAFEQLWAAGADVRLVVVGGEGWKGLPDSERRTIPAIMAALSGHPELGRRLHWLQHISDEYLEQVYAAGACLLAPSEGEGFGLPLIEAARHRLPVLARDIPIFREVAQQHAAYFSGDSGAELAAAVQEWLREHAAGRTIGSDSMPWRTWADNARALAAILFGTQNNQE